MSGKRPSPPNPERPSIPPTPLSPDSRGKGCVQPSPEVGGGSVAQRPGRGPSGITYREAGVDIDAATTALAGIKRHAAKTLAGAAAPIGHFGGIYRLPGGPDRLLVASADGVGTKLKLAFVLGGEAHARVGGDLVRHCVNDLLACGAQPLFFLDYVAMARLDGDVLERLVAGMADACQENGLALIGGETAEMPGFYADGEYDVAGFIVGEVAPERLIDGAHVQAGDVLIGLPSDGLHTNGYSLARRIVGLTGDPTDRERLALPLPGGDGETIGEALMRPHHSYLATVTPLLDAGLIQGMAHITGGGLLDNLPRTLRTERAAILDPTSWPTQSVFDYLVAAGQLSAGERYRALNMGIGFVLVVRPDDAATVTTRVPGSVVIGKVVRRPEGGSQVLGLGDETAEGDD